MWLVIPVPVVRGSWRKQVVDRLVVRLILSPSLVMRLIVVIPSPARLRIAKASRCRLFDVPIAQQKLNASSMWQRDSRSASLNQRRKKWEVEVHNANHLAGRFYG
jgi:hypothetical protein